MTQVFTHGDIHYKNGDLAAEVMSMGNPVYQPLEINPTDVQKRLTEFIEKERQRIAGVVNVGTVGHVDHGDKSWMKIFSDLMDKDLKVPSKGELSYISSGHRAGKSTFNRVFMDDIFRKEYFPVYSSPSPKNPDWKRKGKEKAEIYNRPPGGNPHRLLEGLVNKMDKNNAVASNEYKQLVHEAELKRLSINNRPKTNGGGDW